MKRTFTVCALLHVLTISVFSQTTKQKGDDRIAYERSATNENFSNPVLSSTPEQNDLEYYIDGAIAASAFLFLAFWYSSKRRSVYQASLNGLALNLSTDEVLPAIKTGQRENSCLFEEYIAGLFDPARFKVKKFCTENISKAPANSPKPHPELEFDFSNSGHNHQFAIHCTWNHSFFNIQNETGIFWARKSQIRNYNNYQKNKATPVWVAIGIGGIPSNPEQLYMARLSELKEKFIPVSELEVYKIRKESPRFSFNPNTKRVINQ